MDIINNTLHRCCCFTGHRPEKLTVSESEAKALLKKEIKNSIDSGFNCFICGMSRGIDLWAGQIVLNFKKENENIKLICASPFFGFERRWSACDKRLYNEILNSADLVKFVCRHYYAGCFQIRNRYMVDNCSKVIAAYSGAPGGTKNTINYARSKNVEVVNILDM